MAHRILLAAAFLFLSFPPMTDADRTQPVTILGATPVQQQTAQHAIGRFAEAGMELSGVVIVFHDDADQCNGHDGFIRYDQPVVNITICSDRPYVLPHELAHAWVHANVTEGAKASYVERWGLASWNDNDHDWNERGTEHAAFAIQQNLTATPTRLTNTWLERAEAFESITGLPSPLR